MSPNHDHSTPSGVTGEPRAISHASYMELEDKLNEVEAQLNEANTGLEEAKGQVLRAHAELDNVRKRAEKEVQNAHKYGLERLINELLAVIDGLERGMAIEIDSSNELAKQIHTGLEMTLTLLLNTLEKFQVKQVDPLHQPFDPSAQQAISMQDDSNYPPNVVLQVLQKGYLLNDRLLRPALVIVNKSA